MDTPSEHWSHRGTVIATQSRSLNFISCFNQVDVSFFFYMTPIQPPVWFGIFLSISLLLIWSLLHNYFLSRENFLGYNLSFLFFLFMTLVEKYVRVPSPMAQCLSFRLILCTWSLSVTVLIQCHVGLVISHLNSPPTPKFPETWGDILCHKQVFMDPNQTTRLYTAQKHSASFYNSLQGLEKGAAIKPLEDFVCFSLLSKRVFDHYNLFNPYIFQAASFFLDINLWHLRIDWVYEIWTNFFDGRRRTYPKAFHSWTCK